MFRPPHIHVHAGQLNSGEVERKYCIIKGGLTDIPLSDHILNLVGPCPGDDPWVSAPSLQDEADRVEETKKGYDVEYHSNANRMDVEQQKSSTVYLFRGYER